MVIIKHSNPRQPHKAIRRLVILCLFLFGTSFKRQLLLLNLHSLFTLYGQSFIDLHEHFLESGSIDVFLLNNFHFISIEDLIG